MIYRVTTSALNSQADVDLAQPSVARAICTTPDLRVILNVINVSYTYYDASGRFIGDSAISFNDC